MANFPPLKDQMDLILKGTEEIIPIEELEKKIITSNKENRPLKIKFGCDLEIQKYKESFKMTFIRGQPKCVNIDNQNA